MDMNIRPRRLRGSEILRKMVRETRMDKSSLIYPIFVKEGTGIKEEIPTMPGQYRYSVDTLPKALEELLEAGVNKVMFFGIPDHKDEVGSQAYAQDGIVQRALEKAKEEFKKDMYLITDVCMCDTAVYFADRKWKMTLHWNCWQKQLFPMCRQGLIWWRLLI